MVLTELAPPQYKPAVFVKAFAEKHNSARPLCFFFAHVSQIQAIVTVTICIIFHILSLDNCTVLLCKLVNAILYSFHSSTSQFAIFSQFFLEGSVWERLLGL